MGDWRNNKDEEVELDGIGGVNILVKADVHRSGQMEHCDFSMSWTYLKQASISLAMHLKTRPKLKVLPRWRKGQDIKLLDCQTMSCGISIPRKSKGIWEVGQLNNVSER